MSQLRKKDGTFIYLGRGPTYIFINLVFQSGEDTVILEASRFASMILLEDSMLSRTKLETRFIYKFMYIYKMFSWWEIGLGGKAGVSAIYER